MNTRHYTPLGGLSSRYRRIHPNAKPAIHRWESVGSTHKDRGYAPEALVRGKERVLEGCRSFAALAQGQEVRIAASEDRRLKALGLEPPARDALRAITLPGAARLLAGRPDIDAYVEEVDYRGRRLAKLGLTPGRVAEALRAADEALPAKIRTNPALAWTREQLQFLSILVLNQAYYRVREDESSAFYELSRAEAESRSLEEVLERVSGVLERYSRADAVKITLFAEEKLEAGIQCAPAGDCPGWTWAWARKEKLQNLWIVPFGEGSATTGAMLFGFRKSYDWLPRERELLLAAAERCWRAIERARMLERMVEAEERERRRISRELHDEAGQSLLWVRLQLEMLERECVTSRERLAGVRERVEDTIVELRRLIAALSPAVLEQMGLAAGLRQLAHRFRQMHPAEVRVRMPARLNTPKSAGLLIYRIVQEALSNIAKYSEAGRVDLVLKEGKGTLSVTVADNGKGFDTDAAAARTDCYGLAGLRERVALLGGRVEISSVERRLSAAAPGTKIKIELPIRGEKAWRV